MQRRSMGPLEFAISSILHHMGTPNTDSTLILTYLFLDDVPFLPALRSDRSSGARPTNRLATRQKQMDGRAVQHVRVPIAAFPNSRFW